MNDARTRMNDALAGTPLASRIEHAAALLLERHPDEISALAEETLRGVARTVAAHPDTGVFLGHRPALLAKIEAVARSGLGAHAAALADWRIEDPEDLEGALDALRVLRREETCIAACLQHAGLAHFGEVSEFLSILAETITRRSLELASRAARGQPFHFAVVGMGKIAGREFTYHSDLDLIFLTDGGPEDVHLASRIGQRLISYLTTMTGAGVAYAVDTRLRPSGGQGMLVTTLAGFERYQCEQAQTWEHIAMLRARPIAGDEHDARKTLERVRARVLEGHAPPWPELVAIRRRVEEERTTGDEQEIPFKTGAGGLMDVDFLAGGGLLETHPAALPEHPSVPEMLRAAAAGPGVEQLLEDYALLRRVEAAARWCAGRPVEGVPAGGEELAVVAELTGAGGGDPLAASLASARKRVRAAYDAVIAAGSISALTANRRRG
jgi:glutamate-ammonia-ligase adenylyltransferase